MPENYVLIERTELNDTAASVTFANIPQTGYTDLKIVFSTRDNNGQSQNGLFVSINGSTANFTNRYLLGSGSAASSGSIARFIGYSSGAGATANTFSNGELYFPNYTSANNKSFSSDNVQETNATAAYSVMAAHLWSQTAAITSITLTADSASFIANSTFSLYGIASVGATPVIAPKASGGNIIATDGTYWYHAFLSSGAFVPQTALTCDVLQIAGGGSGGAGYYAAGGGAGGLLAFTSQALANGTSYPATVGAGGAAVSGSGGLQGSNSQFASLTASVGGGGGGGFGANGGNGGSGGGGGGDNSSGTTRVGGSPTTSQGFAGGNGVSISNASTKPAGAGGGAGGVGGNASGDGGTGLGGNGGVGLSTYSSWGLATNTGQNVSGTVFYAGGGGGGSPSLSGGNGGNGGGGAGGKGQANRDTLPISGTANTGGGGGGSNWGAPAGAYGAGGSGIIIIRYAA